MKSFRSLAMAAVLLGCMATFASNALATTATSPKGTIYTGKLVAQSEFGGITITGPIGSYGSIKCAASTLESTIETHGSAESHTLEGKIANLSFTGAGGGKCEGAHVTSPVAQSGRLIIHTTTAGTNSSDGTVTWTGARILSHETAVGKCTFESFNSDIGWITGSTTRGGRTATIDVSGKLPPDGTNPFCGSAATIEGSYEITTPDYLDID